MSACTVVKLWTSSSLSYYTFLLTLTEFSSNYFLFITTREKKVASSFLCSFFPPFDQLRKSFSSSDRDDDAMCGHLWQNDIFRFILIYIVTENEEYSSVSALTFFNTIWLSQSSSSESWWVSVRWSFKLDISQWTWGGSEWIVLLMTTLCCWWGECMQERRAEFSWIVNGARVGWSLSRASRMWYQNENLRWIDLLCCCLLVIVTSLTLSYIISYNQHSIFYISPALPLSMIPTTVWHHELLELTAAALAVVCTIVKWI